MEITESWKNLAGIEFRGLFAETLLFGKMVIEFTSLFEFHRKEDMAFTCKTIFEFYHERVINLPHYFFFILQAREEFTFDYVQFWDNFQSE